jgi:hypothetical protein
MARRKAELTVDEAKAKVAQAKDEVVNTARDLIRMKPDSIFFRSACVRIRDDGQAALDAIDGLTNAELREKVEALQAKEKGSA